MRAKFSIGSSELQPSPMEVVERRVAVGWVGQQVAKSVEQLRASLFPYIPTFSCR